MIDHRAIREHDIAKQLGVHPGHPMVAEAVEIERGERNCDGSWIGDELDKEMSVFHIVICGVAAIGLSFCAVVFFLFTAVH